MLLKKIFNRFLDHNMNKVKSYKPDDHISLSSNHLISFSSKIAIISAILLKNTVFIGEPVPFVLELPAYRIPTLKNVYLNVLD